MAAVQMKIHAQLGVAERGLIDVRAGTRRFFKLSLRAPGSLLLPAEPELHAGQITEMVLVVGAGNWIRQASQYIVQLSYSNRDDMCNGNVYTATGCQRKRILVARYMEGRPRRGRKRIEEVCVDVRMRNTKKDLPKRFEMLHVTFYDRTKKIGLQGAAAGIRSGRDCSVWRDYGWECSSHRGSSIELQIGLDAEHTVEQEAGVESASVQVTALQTAQCRIEAEV